MQTIRTGARRALAAALPPLLLLLLLLLRANPADAHASDANANANTTTTALNDEAADDALLFARMAGLVLARGYPLEMAPVRTTDGHRSLVFRIPRGKAEEQEKERQGDGLLGRRRPRSSSSSSGSSSSQGASDDAPSSWARRAWRLLARLAFPSLARPPRPPPPPKKPVVLLQHGLLGSSADFVLNDPAESLGLALADAGFDVFLANARGNEYGRGGAAAGGPGPASYFWAFSFDEMAAFDLPAAVDHALLAAGARSLHIVAFSQGTAAALASLASFGGRGGVGRGLSPDKVDLAVLIGPVAYAAHVRSAPLRRLAALGTDRLLLLLGSREFSPSSELLRRLGGDLCLATPELCVSALTAICGYSPDKGDPRRIPFYLNYTPSGTSTQNIGHWAQAVRGRAAAGGGGDDDDDLSGSADGDGGVVAGVDAGGDGDGDDGDGGDDEGAGGCCSSGGGDRRSRGGNGGDGAPGGGARGARAKQEAAARRASGCFCAFDYGREANRVVYGGLGDPPEYDLRRGLRQAKVPVVLVTGGRDRLADPRDAALLSAALEDAGVLRALHHEPTFEHLDFLWGVKELAGVYGRVIGELRRHRDEAEEKGAGTGTAPPSSSLGRRVAATRRFWR